MAVKIRMKKMGRKHRPFYRICAADVRSPRDGRFIEELGTYDTSVPDTDARVVLNNERVAYWLSVGAQPSDNVRILIKKYGPEGTHLDQQRAARERLAAPKQIGELNAPKFQEKAKAAPPAPVAEAPVSETPATEASAEPVAAEDATEAPSEG